MDIECTGRRIGDEETRTQEVVAWTKRRNDQEKKINWKFTKEKADKKLSKYYVYELNCRDTTFIVAYMRR
jgi:hypothetical protein